VRPDEVPDELTTFPQWVARAYRFTGGKWKKPPLKPGAARLADPRDPADWSAFDEARRRLREPSVDGRSAPGEMRERSPAWRVSPVVGDAPALAEGPGSGKIAGEAAGVPDAGDGDRLPPPRDQR
jgi:hypothetical protein